MKKIMLVLAVLLTITAASCGLLKKKGAVKKSAAPAAAEQAIKPQSFAGSEDALFHYNLGTVLYNKHKYIEALDEFKKALSLNPTDEIKLKSNMIMGAIYDDMNKLADAEKSYTAALAVNSDNLEANYNLGTVQAKKGDYKDAVESFKKALNIKKSDLESLINLGNSYLHLNNYEAAIGIYEEALKINPAMPDIMYNLAYAYQTGGYYEKALQEYEKVLKADKQRQISKQVYLNMGSIYDEKGELAKAVRIYKRGLALDPENADIRFNLSLTLMKKGALTEALKQLQKTISIRRDDPDVYLTMGNIYYDLKKYSAAKKNFEKSIALKANPRAILFLANILYKQKDYQKARKYYEKIVTIEKTTDTARLAYIGLADIYDNFADYPNSIEFYKKAIDLSPTDAGLHYNLAVVQIKAKQFAAAISELKRSLDLDNKNFKALKLISDALYNLGKLDESLDFTKRGLKIDPKDFDLNYVAANIWLKKGQEDTARKFFKTCLSLKPPAAKAKIINVNIGNTYSSAKKYAVALKYYQNAIKLDPKYGTAYYNMAISNYKLNRLSRAINNLLETIKYDPTNIDAHSLLGNLYYKKGMLDLAEQEYKAAIELGSKDIEVMDKLKEIRSIKQ